MRREVIRKHAQQRQGRRRETRCCARRARMRPGEPPSEGDDDQDLGEESTMLPCMRLPPLGAPRPGQPPRRVPRSGRSLVPLPFAEGDADAEPRDDAAGGRARGALPRAQRRTTRCRPPSLLDEEPNRRRPRPGAPLREGQGPPEQVRRSSGCWATWSRSTPGRWSPPTSSSPTPASSTRRSSAWPTTWRWPWRPSRSASTA